MRKRGITVTLCVCPFSLFYLLVLSAATNSLLEGHLSIILAQFSGIFGGIIQVEENTILKNTESLDSWMGESNYVIASFCALIFDGKVLGT